MKIDAVIFDIGNVLIEWQPEQHYRAWLGAERQQAFFESFDFHGLINEIDAGAPFHATVEAAAAARPEFGAEILMLRRRWLELTGGVIARSVRLLRGLKAAGVPVFALSNFGSENFQMSVRAHPFLSEFDRAYISGDMGMRKPFEPIYAAVEADCGLAPERLLFGDDRADNIATARARGWQTHRVDSAQSWAQALVSYGLLSEEAAR
ncbi:HAD family phosphatase [uncultured Lentibacter sp.]|uniref:HAD family hydrolase n=1 Tax=uncultured Lentibacter sp. TaxID=1659309 RepID=UPI00261DC5E7|nr:HAD family phosphatase [uncultured Lentibacter sp.]